MKSSPSHGILRRVLPAVFSLVFLFPAIFVVAADGNRQPGDGMFIATTGRILTIDLRNKTIRVRGSDGQAVRDFAPIRTHVTSSVITFPGGLTIHLPGRTAKTSSKTGGNMPNLDAYTVVTTDKTVFQDGAESIRLENFTVGETISIHGVLSGNTLTASRVAKWS